MLTAVYLLWGGSYDQRDVVGVYASLEAAMVADPGDWVQTDDWDGTKWVPGSTRWHVPGREVDIEAYEVRS